MPVVVGVSAGERQEAEGAHVLVPDQHGQKLVVDHVLVLCVEDPPRLLVDPLVAPVRVDCDELARDPVVLAQEQRVHHGQVGLLVDARVASLEAGAAAAAVGVVRVGREEVLAAEQLRLGLKATAAE